MKKQDILTPIGLVLVFCVCIYGIAAGPTGMKGIGMFIDPPSFAITIVGSFAAVLITFTIDDLKKIPKALKISITSSNIYKMDLVDQFKEISRVVRKDGLLAIEQDVSEMEDPFLKKGLELVIDGIEPENVKEILETELASKEAMYGNASNFFKIWGSYAPAFGMIGTLIGLILMLSDMGSPDDIASGMSVALITTLYGALFANGVFNPIGYNIQGKGEKEIEALEMMICGITSIQNGESTRTIEEKLVTFLNEKERKTYYTRDGNEESANAA